jgi:hypothetical protein
LGKEWIARRSRKKQKQLSEQIEEAGLKPHTICFNGVITTLANSHDPSAGERAEAILMQMNQLHEADNPDVKPNTVRFKKW